MLFNCIPTIHQQAALPLPRSAKSCIAALSLLAVPLRLRQRATYHAICDYVLLRVVWVWVWVGKCLCVSCLCVCTALYMYITSGVGTLYLLACIYIPPSAAPRLPPPSGRARAVRCTKLDPERVRSCRCGRTAACMA